MSQSLRRAGEILGQIAATATGYYIGLMAHEATKEYRESKESSGRDQESEIQEGESSAHGSQSQHKDSSVTVL